MNLIAVIVIIKFYLSIGKHDIVLRAAIYMCIRVKK